MAVPRNRLGPLLAKVIGWAIRPKIDRHLALVAVRAAIVGRRILGEVLHHTDQGSQYASSDNQDALEADGLVCSMSRRGNCCDNAPVESFFGTLKTELVHHEDFKTREEAKARVFEFIGAFEKTAGGAIRRLVT